MLEEAALLARKPTATATNVSVHFAAPLEAAARQQVNACDVESLLADSGRAVCLGKLADAAQGGCVCIGIGIAAADGLGPGQSVAARRPGGIAASASQSQRLTRAAQLFKQFQEVRAAAPDVPPEKILQQLGEGAGRASGNIAMPATFVSTGERSAARSGRWPGRT